MPKMTRGDSKAALAQQRTQLRRSARGKIRIGQDTGAAAAQASEREKVRLMREHFRAESIRHKPLAPMLAGVAIGAVRLAGTFLTLPFRLAAALLGRAPRPAGA